MEFEWDLEKELENIKKHQVSFLEAQETFLDPFGIAMKDIIHSCESEERFYWIGQNSDGRILTTRFTYRKTKIRIFGSAEWRKFRRIYEAAKNK